MIDVFPGEVGGEGNLVKLQTSVKIHNGWHSHQVRDKRVTPMIILTKAHKAHTENINHYLHKLFSSSCELLYLFFTKRTFFPLTTQGTAYGKHRH